jgi:cytochrome c oxidase subunit 3
VGATILVFSGMAVVVVWWLSKQRLTAKPWLQTGAAGEILATGASPLPTAKIGLGVFLAVVGSLFALFLSAYLMRMSLADWRPVPKPTVLWFSTGVLILASVALQWAKDAAQRGEIERVRTGLAAAGVATFAFLAGQLLGWRQLSATGHLLASNPASTFFYLITALHGLHLLGGLVAWGRTSLRAWRGAPDDAVKLSVELCSMYWDFLLLVWLVLFFLLFFT